LVLLQVPVLGQVLVPVLSRCQFVVSLLQARCLLLFLLLLLVAWNGVVSVSAVDAPPSALQHGPCHRGCH